MMEGEYLERKSLPPISNLQPVRSPAHVGIRRACADDRAVVSPANAPPPANQSRDPSALRGRAAEPGGSPVAAAAVGDGADAAAAAPAAPEVGRADEPGASEAATGRDAGR